MPQRELKILAGTFHITEMIIADAQFAIGIILNENGAVCAYFVSVIAFLPKRGSKISCGAFPVSALGCLLAVFIGFVPNFICGRSSDEQETGNKNNQTTCNETLIT